MKLASLVAGTILATALTTSAFADDPNASTTISITFTEKGKAVCAMDLTEPAKGVLIGKSSSSCGGNVAGFLTGSGKTEVLLLASGGASVTVDWFVDVSTKQFVAIAFNGKSASELSGTVTIK